VQKFVPSDGHPPAGRHHKGRRDDPPRGSNQALAMDDPRFRRNLIVVAAIHVLAIAAFFYSRAGLLKSLQVRLSG